MYDPNKDFFINQSTDQKTLPERYHITQVALFASGIFAGATVRLEVSPDEWVVGADPELMDWYDHPNGTYTSAETTEQRFWNNAELSTCWVRAVIVNAAPTSSISFKMRPRLSVEH